MSLSWLPRRVVRVSAALSPDASMVVLTGRLAPVALHALTATDLPLVHIRCDHAGVAGPCLFWREEAALRHATWPSMVGR
jgi:hypothetical protein